ncbi:MAG: Hsp20/alpha crystallin family protein [Candidatus Lokiarchaeota archaeon]|nr:Hsp20/alpha crystallin family protein [Candidatus Lokiarchaeota archaeon]
MAEAKDTKTDLAVTKEKSEEIYWRIRPYYSSDFDSETGEYHARVELPGVPKENVKLRVLPDLFDLRATREHTQYLLTEYFPYDMDVNSIEAKYEHGLLTIKGKFKDPLDSAVEISLK